MTWADRARRLISQAHNDQLGDDATLEERRQTLKTIGVSFSQGTSHGRKVWNSEMRRYLSRYDQRPPPGGLFK